MTRDQRSRRHRPCLEGLETRDLLSTLHVLGPVKGQGGAKGPYLNLIVQSDQVAGTAGRVSAGGGRTATTPPWVNESLLQGVAQTLFAPITTTSPVTVGGQTFPPGTYSVPQPTEAEIKRETFWAEFVGHYSVGAPRFSNQSATIHIYSNGRDVTSNQTLQARAGPVAAARRPVRIA